ncbi:hypothetical protein AB4178_08220, partial [Vibrio splendidus]
SFVSLGKDEDSYIIQSAHDVEPNFKKSSSSRARKERVGDLLQQMKTKKVDEFRQPFLLIDK